MENKKKDQLKKIASICKGKEDYEIRKRILFGEKKSDILKKNKLREEFNYFYSYITEEIDFETLFSELKKEINRLAWCHSYNNIMTDEEHMIFLANHGYTYIVDEFNKIRRFKDSVFYKKLAN